MSASKKKRLGSQRRPLSSNVKDSSETSDKALSPPVPQGRQRADANADLPLSPDSAQPESSARKKKLGSQRGNKGKQHSKDATTESSHKPIEEVKDLTTQLQAPDAPDTKNEGIDELLGRNNQPLSPVTEAAGSDLLLNDDSNSRLSTITEPGNQLIVIQDTNMDTTSDILLKVASSEKYLNVEVANTEEGVFSETDQAQQMPDIFESTIPAGVTGESTCTVSLIEQEELNSGSHDHNNKHNTGEKAGPIEKPVCQDSDSSSSPRANTRKMGSSGREKVTEFEELQEQGIEMTMPITALETTGFTIVDYTQEVHVTGETYKEDEVENNLSPKTHEEKMDDDHLSDIGSDNLSIVKIEEPLIENVTVEMKGDTSFDIFAREESEEKSEKAIKDETLVSTSLSSELLCENESDKSPFAEIKTEKEEAVTEFMIAEKPEPLISFLDEESLVPGQGNNINLSDELQKEESFDFSLQLPQAFENAQYFTADASLDDAEKDKIIEIAETFSQSVCDDSLQHPDETFEDNPTDDLTTATVVHPITESDTYLKENIDLDEDDKVVDKSSVTIDASESSPESTSFTKDETVETMFGALQEVKPVIEGVLQLDQNEYDLLDTTTESIASNETDSAKTEDVHHEISVSEALEDLPGQPSEPLINLTGGVSFESIKPYKEEDTEETNLSHEQLDNLQTDMSLEPKTLNTPTASTTEDAGSMDDENSTCYENDEKNEAIITPEMVIEELEVESVDEEKSTEMFMENKNQAAGLEDMDKTQILVHDGSDSGSDHEDWKYTSKPTDDTEIVVINDVSDAQPTEQLVTVETTAEPFETVQNINVAGNAPDTDSNPGPVRRKFGSSRRSKAKTDAANVTTIDNEDTLSIEKEDLLSSLNVQTDDQIEPMKKEENPKVGNAEDSELSSLNVQIPETDENTENQAALDKVDESIEAIQNLITNDDVLKPSEVTTLFVAKQTAEELISTVEDKEAPDNPNLEQTSVDFPHIQELSIEPKNYAEQMNVNTGDFAVKDTINVHQLTYISDSETREDIDDSSLQLKTPVLEETMEEPSKNVSTSDSDAHHGHRRKLGSSRRVKERKLEDIPTENNDNEDSRQPETQEIEDTTIFVLSDKDQTDKEQAIQTQFVSIEEKTFQDNQKENPEEVADSSIIIDLKDKSIVQAEDLSQDIDIDNSFVAESKEKMSANLDDPMESVITSTEDMIKEYVEDQVSSAIQQINSEPKDEVCNAESNVTILVKDAIDDKESGPTVNKDDAEPQMKTIFEKKDEKNLQTENILVEDVDKGVITQTLPPTGGGEIQPSSPGKRRKMGSTRKNVLSKKEDKQEETPTILEKEVDVSISSENNESKEDTGLLVYTATVHQPPPDEETPLSQQITQERLRSESKEAELSPQQDVMALDAAIARRRKMGSHRKPHSDQRGQTDSEESLLHPLGKQREESPKLTQLSEVNEGEDRVSPSATAFNVRVDSRPASERITPHPKPSTNVPRVQESNIRIAAGFDRSATRYEVVMIGDSSVGKTSFIQRAQSGKFSADIPASIGMDSYKWTVVVNGKTVVLHLWDTAGQERFRSMTKQIFHRAQAFLLTYDVTCAQTFTAVSYWANCIKEGAAEDAVVLLLGNKSDRVERKVQREDGQFLAEENRFAFMECSAATGENVIEALETVARMLSQKVERREEPLLLRKPEPRNKGCC